MRGVYSCLLCDTAENKNGAKLTFDCRTKVPYYEYHEETAVNYCLPLQNLAEMAKGQQKNKKYHIHLNFFLCLTKNRTLLNV